MSESQTQTNSEKGGKKKGIAIVVLVAVVAVLVGVIIYLVMPKEEEKRNVVVTEDNIGETMGQMEQAEENYTPPGYFTATMNYEWHFPDGKSPSTDAHVENVSENTNDVYFDLFLADDVNEEDPLYESPVIPLGNYLEKITLDKDLDAGEYDCVCVYHLVDEDQNSISTASFSVKVVVEN